MSDVKQVIQDTLKCQNVTYRDVLRAALTEIERLERLTAALHRNQFEHHQLARIATALEKAAQHGWGNVFGESLLGDRPAQPGEGS